MSTKQFFFNDRDGHTVLSAKERKGLKLTHISNMGELDEAEQMNINEGLFWLKDQKTGEFLNETFFLTLHKKLFGEVWKWAGAYRTSEKNIGVEAWKVPTEMHKFIQDTDYWLKEDSFKTWTELLAHFHHRLVSIHPFPNGNGRFSRIMTNYLCQRSKKATPDWWTQLPPQERREKYISALRKADQRKFTSLVSFFDGPCSKSQKVTSS